MSEPPTRGSPGPARTGEAEPPVAAPPVADTPLWLSHHWPGDYDRCVVIAGRHLCRRCLVLYPLAALAAAIAGAVGAATGPAAVAAGWLLPLPAVIDFVAEQRGWARPSPPRLVAVTVLLAAACGVLYARYLANHTDPAVWGPVAVWGGIWVAAAVQSARGRTAAPPG